MLTASRRRSPIGRTSQVAVTLAVLATLPIWSCARSADEDGSADRADAQPELFYRAVEPSWSPPAGSATPSWTPDGKEIVFQSVRDQGGVQIFAIRPDGTRERRITDGSFRAGSPHCCSADGRLAFVSDKDGAREIYTMGLDGSDVEQVTSDGVPKLWPVFSPDGDAVLFAQGEDGQPRRQLAVLHLETGETRVLYDSEFGLGWATWSPDGREIYSYDIVDGHNHLFRIGRDGSGFEHLTEGDDGDYWSPQVAPSGGLSYVYAPRVNGAFGGNGDLYLLSTDESNAVRLTRGPRYESGQRFSPDGKWMTFLGLDTGYWELYVKPVTGGHPTQLTWQPDVEITQLARAEGAAVALTQYREHRDQGFLFSEGAMRHLLEDFSEDASFLDLAEAFAETYPDSPHAHRAVAYGLLRKGKRAQALERLGTVIRLRPNDLYAVDQVGFEKSLEILRELAAEGRLPELPVNALGYELLRAERGDEAIAVFQLNAETFPDSWNAHDSLGEALLGAGEVDAARIAYERSLRLNPGNETARRVLEETR